MYMYMYFVYNSKVQGFLSTGYVCRIFYSHMRTHTETRKIYKALLDGDDEFTGFDLSSE